MDNKIVIRGARMHNLKNIDLEIPKNKLVVFTGLSGSGKSTLAFDTLFAEGQRRYIESLSPYARQFLGQMDRPDVDEITGLSPAIAIDQKALSHNPRSTVGTLTEIYDYLRVLYARVGEVYCPKCGTKIERLTLEEMVNIIQTRAGERRDEYVTILSPVVRGRKGEYYQLLYNFLSLGYGEAVIDGKKASLHDRVDLARHKKHDIDIVMDKVLLKDGEARLFEAVESAIQHSAGLVKVVFSEEKKNSEEIILSSLWTCPKDNFSFPEVEPRLFSFNSPVGACPVCMGLGKVEFGSDKPCVECKGKRLRPEALSVMIKNKNIHNVTELTIDKAYAFFEQVEARQNARQRLISKNLIKEIKSRLQFMLAVGLEYLTLDREAGTLSGGEAQRIRLASQIGTQLTGTLYVLDEPTIGLHERDTEKLVETLKKLRDLGNSVVIVEHDEKTIESADYLVDLGPGAGRAGGYLVAAGLLADLKRDRVALAKSLTLQYLTGKKKIALPDKRKTNRTEEIRITGATANNLKNVAVGIPLRKLVCLTGVSGSGKSSLLYDVLYENVIRVKNRRKLLENVAKISGTEYIDGAVIVNQSPIGRSPRSNPATYTGIFTPIREFFAELPAARERGYSISRFSFNRPGGRCEACEGAGHNLIEMHFLPPVLVKCEVCQGKRFNRETLQVKYKKHNISEVLSLTIEEAYQLFSEIPQIADKLKVLEEVGLGYLQLGQSATTLSGGEAQRVKLARELTAPLGRRILYLLDEPSVGLHYADVKMLLLVLRKLVDRGNSVVLIEHNMQIIKCADYLIDLGPEGGIRGGKLVATGTPEEILKYKESCTGKYLKKYLSPNPSPLRGEGS